MALLWPKTSYRDPKLGVEYSGSYLLVDEVNEQALFFSPSYEGLPDGCYVSIFNFNTLQFSLFEVNLPWTHVNGDKFFLAGGTLWAEQGSYFCKLALTSPTSFGTVFGPIYSEQFSGGPINGIAVVGNEVFVSGNSSTDFITKFNVSTGAFIDYVNLPVFGYFAGVRERNGEILILNADPFVGTGESMLYNPTTGTFYVFMQDITTTLWLDSSIGSNLTGSALDSYLHTIQAGVQSLIDPIEEIGNIGIIKNIQNTAFYAGAYTSDILDSRFGAFISYDLTNITFPKIGAGAQSYLSFSLGDFYKIANKYWIADLASGYEVILLRPKGGWKVGAV